MSDIKTETARISASQTDLKRRLDAVSEAINAILYGGQEYTIGSRKLKRADLKQLLEEQSRLEARINADNANGFLDDTYVAIWDKDPR